MEARTSFRELAGNEDAIWRAVVPQFWLSLFPQLVRRSDCSWKSELECDWGGQTTGHKNTEADDRNDSRTIRRISLTEIINRRDKNDKRCWRRRPQHR